MDNSYNALLSIHATRIQETTTPSYMEAPKDSFSFLVFFFELFFWHDGFIRHGVPNFVGYAL